MSKPIFIVRLPIPKYTSEIAEEIAHRLNRKTIAEDYHILVLVDEFTGGETKFECYNAPHTEMEFEELKRRVLELLKD